MKKPPYPSYIDFVTKHIGEVAKSCNVSAFEIIQPISKTGYPIVKEILPYEIIKIDRNDPAFDKPYSELTKTF